MSDYTRFWKGDYKESRQTFRDYTTQDYRHYCHKTYGKVVIDQADDTTIDYMYLHNPPDHSNGRLHIIISGTHGVEGYAGSAIQCKTLENILNTDSRTHQSDLSRPTSYLFIHALNPYGYLHNRRFTKNNVDLNRNYLSLFRETQYPAIFNRLVSTYMFSLYFLYLFFVILYRYGYTKAREYIVRGQYSYPDSLFYGGNKREENIEVLETILDKVDSHDFTEIYIFDVHTGLGSYGNLSIMVPECTYRELSNLYCNSQTSMINITNNNMYQDSVGSVVTGIEHYFRHNKCYPGSVYPVILEYGTYSNLRIFAGLLMENYYFTQKNKDWGLSKNTLRGLFNVEDPTWRRMIITNYLDLIVQF